MDSPSQPQSPDPYKVADAQQQTNDASARLTTQLSRPNQYTPYGNLVWTNDKTFDQAGYDAAMQKYNAAQQAGSTNGQQVITGNDGSVTGYKSADGTTLTAPDKNSFYTGGDNWSSHIELDPRVQKLVDANLGTSQKLQDATGNAVDQVNSAFAKPIDYNSFTKAADVGTQLNQAAMLTSNIRPAVDGAVTNAVQGQQLANQAGAQWGANMQPLSYGNLGAMPSASDRTRQNVIDAYYGQARSRLDPQFQQADDKLRSTLMNRGIVAGSDAWNTEMQNQGRTQNDAYTQALDNAQKAGTDQMGQQFGMQMQGRQQGVTEDNALWQAPQTQALNAQQFSGGAMGQMGTAVGAQDAQNAGIYQNANTGFNMQNTQRQNQITEAEQQRTAALNYLASLRSGTQAQMPTFQQSTGPTVQPANVSGNVYQSYQGDMNAYNAQLGSQNSLLGGIASLGSAAMMSPVGTFAAFSDRRLKGNIFRIGTHPSGVGWYKFRYLGGVEAEGVMADELRAIGSSAVFQTPSGYDAVDYAALGA